MEKYISFALFLLIFIVLDIYTYQSFKTLIRNKYTLYIYWSITFIVLCAISYLFLTTDRRSQDAFSIQWLLGLLIVFYLPKIFAIIPLLLEDIFRIIRWFISLFSKESSFFPSRRKAVSLLAIGMASIPFLSSIYGIFKGRFQYKIHRVVLKFKDLPKSFDGYKIVQLSDIHSGSFKPSHIDEIRKGIQLLNKENPDLVLFTGDLVNFISHEIKPFLSVFSEISCTQKYSVFGNHDYGEYFFDRKSPNFKAQCAQNLNEIAEYQKQIGFTNLRNSTVKIHKGSESINLIGVENYGKLGRFPQTGDLPKATENISEGEFNLLMSHDPTHFDEVVKTFQKHIHITLSGHTHGMQMGIELPFLKFSPVQFVYKKWAGLYEENSRYLYVNRGFGFLGMPARIGILPEITVFELKSES